ncbi:MAG: NRDE family protein [Rhodanobacter sp.]
MCVLAFAWNVHLRWRLLLAGNRDEFHARPTAALAAWDDAPISAGRDERAGGTWLGVAAGGRCSTVTNVRDPADSQAGASRGRLVADYLAGRENATEYADHMYRDAADYRPFNLLLFDANAAFYLGNRPAAHKQAVTAGVHGLSNATLDTPWPKTSALMRHLQAWIEQEGGDDFSPLFAALADERLAPDTQLPDSGVGLALERLLSPAFVRGQEYGTRASTVVAIDHDGNGVIVERRFGPNGRFDGETTLPIVG